jgi:hypothetical protein
MVNKTPIRLVAIDEEPPDESATSVPDFMLDLNTAPTPIEDDAEPTQDAAPVRLAPEHEAITRKVPAVPEPASVASPLAAPAPGQGQGWQKQAPPWRKYVPLIVAFVPLAGLSIWWLSSRSAPSKETVTSPANRDQVATTPTPAPHTTPVPPLPSQTQQAPEVIRLQITAAPVQAELALDGNVLAGHHLNLEVPKDRGIHVVSASAPGYLPFNQQVIYSSDIVLHINLRRMQGASGRQASRQSASPGRAVAPAANKTLPAAPPPMEIKPQNSGKSHPSSAPHLEPGMDLDTPAPRRGPKSLDERNPYRP